MSLPKSRVIKLPSNTWFTSDPHYFHKNIMKYCPRTRGHLKSVEEMNEALIKAHNDCVDPNDVVVFGGDISFGQEKETLNVMRRLNGTKYGVKGNHDPSWFVDYAKKEFVAYEDYLELSIEGVRIVVFHYPITEWNGMHHGAYHLFGHVHGKAMKNLGRSMDIGVDARPNNDLRPWAWPEIDAKLRKEPIKEHGGVNI